LFSFYRQFHHLDDTYNYKYFFIIPLICPAATSSIQNKSCGLFRRYCNSMVSLRVRRTNVRATCRYYTRAPQKHTSTPYGLLYTLLCTSRKWFVDKLLNTTSHVCMYLPNTPFRKRSRLEYNIL